MTEEQSNVKGEPTESPSHYGRGTNRRNRIVGRGDASMERKRGKGKERAKDSMPAGATPLVT